MGEWRVRKDGIRILPSGPRPDADPQPFNGGDPDPGTIHSISPFGQATAIKAEKKGKIDNLQQRKSFKIHINFGSEILTFGGRTVKLATSKMTSVVAEWKE